MTPATEVREGPMLFSGPMVRAIRREVGPKTQTRRIVKWKPIEAGLSLEASSLKVGHYFTGAPDSGWVLRSMGGSCWNDRTFPAHCPHGKPGDRLWVRETHHIYEQKIYRSGGTDRSMKVIYREDGGTLLNGAKWKPSIFMPRWASRITLQLDTVRVERLNLITIADARAEGITEYWHEMGMPTPKGFGDEQWADIWRNRSSIENYMWLWEVINGLDSREANPHVWVLSFHEIEAAR